VLEFCLDVSLQSPDTAVDTTRSSYSLLFFRFMATHGDQKLHIFEFFMFHRTDIHNPAAEKRHKELVIAKNFIDLKQM
jgi:hypothetical protein